MPPVFEETPQGRYRFAAPGGPGVSAGALAALLTTLIDRAAPAPALQAARLDLEVGARSAPRTVDAEVRIVRPGQRVQTIDAFVRDGDALLVRATLQRVRSAQTPDPLARDAWDEQGAEPLAREPRAEWRSAVMTRAVEDGSLWVRPGAPVLEGAPATALGLWAEALLAGFAALAPDVLPAAAGLHLFRRSDPDRVRVAFEPPHDGLVRAVVGDRRGAVGQAYVLGTPSSVVSLGLRS